VTFTQVIISQRSSRHSNKFHSHAMYLYVILYVLLIYYDTICRGYSLKVT